MVHEERQRSLGTLKSYENALGWTEYKIGLWSGQEEKMANKSCQ